MFPAPTPAVRRRTSGRQRRRQGTAGARGWHHKPREERAWIQSATMKRYSRRAEVPSSYVTSAHHCPSMGSPRGLCFDVGAALREPFGRPRCEPEFIPVIQCAPLRIAPMAPLPTCREPVALPLRSVLTPWAEAIAGMPITTAAARQAVGKLNRTVIFFRDAVWGGDGQQSSPSRPSMLVNTDQLSEKLMRGN